MSLRAKQTTAIFVSVVVAALMVVLGLWQMHRFQLSVVEIAAERAAQPAVELSPAVHEDGSIDDVYGRRVTVSGQYLPDVQEVVGTSEARVVTAFQLDDGRHVAVVRGHIAEGAAVPSPPAGHQTIEGIFLASDSTEDRTSGSVRLQSLAQTWPSPLIGGYVTLDEQHAKEQGLQVAEAELPEQKGTAMHQGYAMQWWVFAIASIAFGVFTARQFRLTEEAKRARIAQQREAMARTRKQE